MWAFRKPVRVIAVWILLAATALAAQSEKWSEQKARDWYARQPWLVGSNYNPASAINQLEMWQADSFDPKRIDLELGWAESLGMNTMRVYLHVGMINWGLVQGKTQTHLPWDSWQRPYVDREPSVWFHEVFRNDGQPYIAEEVEFIKRMTGKTKPQVRRAAQR